MSSSSNTTLPSQALLEPSRCPKRAGQSEEPEKKPKKVNSEIRKQQNRIASRNYREKRKRKLQYLQQLIRDGSNDEHESEPSPDPHDTYARSLSVDYDLAGASQSPYILPSSSDFGPMSSSSTSASYTVAAATSATFDSGHHLAPMHTYVSYPPSWSASVYSPPPPVDVAWTVPSPWMSGMDHSARVAPRPDMYRYTPSPSQPVFEQAHTPSHTPSHEPHVFMSTSDLYGFASTYAPQNQASGSPNVSLPTSSSYYHGHYTGSH